VPVINKVDLPSAEPERVKEQIEAVIGLDASNAVLTSAKTGLGTEEVLEAIVQRVPAPRGANTAPLQALLFDSWFDPYRGVIILVRVMEGTVRVGQKIRLMSNGESFQVETLAVRTPKTVPVAALEAGEVGLIVANIKRVADAQIGDTITDDASPAAEPLAGFEQIKPMVFAGLYPTESDQHTLLREALEKLRLNDSSFFFEPESSAALGFGFRCGFLGLLHMEIVQERLEREFSLDLIVTAPGVRYQVLRRDGVELDVNNPEKLPPPGEIESISEPIITATIIANDDSLGGILALCEDKRGVQKGFEYVGPQRVMLTYALPLNEVVLDFYDRLKTVSRGYASLDYHLSGYEASDLVELDVLVAGEPVDALSM
ncbi:MAG: translation elongation factor 4, partial [Terriglobales bacterium]